MPQIIWDESLSINNSEIDAQHKKWIAMYNNLHEASVRGNSEELMQVMKETLHEMNDYAHYHFDFEEEYMQSIGYPYLDEHRLQHENFKIVIEGLQKDMIEGKPVFHNQIMQIMKKWIVDHISRSDKKYADFYSSLNK